jgi:hypothetical protein
MRPLLALGLALTMTACAHPAGPTAPRAEAPNAMAVQGRSARDLSARVLRPEAVPAAVLDAVLPRAQKAADDASRKRKIDFFNLHAAPIGLRVGETDGYVLSFLGTSKQRTDLNVELRAVYAADQVGVIQNYSGPVTLSRLAGVAGTSQQAPVRRRGAGVSFELIMGLPGAGVADAYVEYMTYLERHLERRYGARPFTFDDGPIIFAVHEGDAVTGYVFTNQGNRLVLGDRKYADVQSVVHVGADADVKAAYTLIGFNPKTATPTSLPDYRYDEDARFGLMVEFGQL